MMTHGWRRYDISEALKGNYMIPKTGYETTKEISGSVKRLIRGRSVANSKVFVVTNDGSFSKIETESTGLFNFSAHYQDSINFFLQAKDKNEKSNLELTLNHEKFPELKHVPGSQLSIFFNESTNNQTVVNGSDFKRKAEQRTLFDDDMKLIQLPEVEVSAKKIEKKDKARLEYRLNSISDITIYKADIEKRNPLQVSDMLLGVAGVQVFNDTIVRIRESNLKPLIVIDGIPMEINLSDINVHEVEAIDIFKVTASAAIFGQQGIGGVISITLKKGSSITSTEPVINFVTYAPIGFQKPVEFYAPKYDTPESKRIGTPDFRSTIFWKPDLIVSDDGKASFEFYTSDFPTTYSVVLEGLSNDGKIIRQIEKIEVR
jgi:hypothetical protein